LKINAREKEIISTWEKVFEYAKKTDNIRGKYNPALIYGVYQIYAELDTSVTIGKGKTVYDNIELHSALKLLKGLVGSYYNEEIVPVLFEYEFLK
jgi:maltose-binding protein MalE